jgi:transcriptional regulator with XRE-family HTH domain
MRVARELSQVDFASELGYSSNYLGQIERGAANISCDVMAAVSSYFKQSIGQFWTYAESLPNRPRKKQ